MRPVIFSYAFRPFFLVNGIFAVLVLVAWLAMMRGWNWPGAPGNPLLWHAHEMLVGFVMAAVAGFSLTAVSTWTGRPAVSGASLGFLVLAWLAGRLAVGISGVLPNLVVIAVDMAFPVFLWLLLTREVVAGGSKRNYPVAGMVALMAILNLIYHLNAGANGRLAMLLFVHLVLLLVTVIAGRIIPNFTTNWLRRYREDSAEGTLPRSRSWLETAVFVLTAMTGVGAVVAPTAPASALLALATGLVHAFRLSQWRGWSVRRDSLMFVLHIGLCLVGGWLRRAGSVRAGMGIQSVGRAARADGRRDWHHDYGRHYPGGPRPYGEIPVRTRRCRGGLLGD